MAKERHWATIDLFYLHDYHLLYHLKFPLFLSTRVDKLYAYQMLLVFFYSSLLIVVA